MRRATRLRGGTAAILVVMLSGISSTTARAEEAPTSVQPPCPIVPIPKVYRDSGSDTPPSVCRRLCSGASSASFRF